MSDRPETDQERREGLFRCFENAAVAGVRCPKLGELRDIGHVAPSRYGLELARSKRIKIEVYGQNWRVVEIRDGPNSFCRTAEPPSPSEPYKVIFGHD